ncbi:glycosyltransferase family 2 protein [Candidatus Pelagibacter sp.]|nr:glycosyltransferase family 2 protein [Candidatus Pelagibacter sp.]
MKISIITVSYNSENFIESCINSIISQSYKDIEYIIIDGSSKDNTLKIIQRYSRYVSTIVSEPDKGIYDAMNKGIKIAKGEIIGFLHSDDMYKNENVLSKVAKIFKNNASLDACYADLIYVKKINTSRIVRYWKSSKFIKGSFSKGWSPPHPTFFVRRSVYERYGNFNLKYPIVSDIELMMRLLEVHNIQTQYLNEIWIKMRLGGLSNKNFKSILKQNKDILRALRSHALSNNLIIFAINKILSRVKQFFQRPKS